MSEERELLIRAKSTLDIEYSEDLINDINELLAQPEQEQEVYAKGYAEAMRQQVYEAFEAGRKSAFSNDWNKERDAMSEAWYLPESKQEPVAEVGSVFSLLWINRGHHRVSVGDFLYTAPPTREPLSEEAVFNLAVQYSSKIELARAIEKAHGIGVADE